MTGFNVCVDQVHRLDSSSLDRVATAGSEGGPAAALASELTGRIIAGRDGEVFCPAPQLVPWLEHILGQPDSRQVGGTSAQAAWTLAMLGAPTVLALADRSEAQLDVLHPAINLCTAYGTQPAGQATAQGPTSKPPHIIVEFAAGTTWRGNTLDRSSRIIVRFAYDGIERDQHFADLSPTLDAGAGLLSGFNCVPENDHDSSAWVRRIACSWRDAGLMNIHLELAEYPRSAALTELLSRYAGLAHSVGMNLTELHTLTGRTGDPALAARDVAERYALAQVYVHADTWSLALHRGDAAMQIDALTTANLIAAARARRGAPTAHLEPDDRASFTADHPSSGPLDDKWRADCVPTPHLSQPSATIGLGDSFVAGLLLAACLSQR
jgi:ADP-dependent phosphofructokinase/glucokinase